jgi:hypothetical protein
LIESSLGDFGVRKYDEEIGRFTSIDPLWEKYYSWTPYHYCSNNPVLGSDPGGMIIIPQGTDKQKEKIQNYIDNIKGSSLLGFIVVSVLENMDKNITVSYANMPKKENGMFVPAGQHNNDQWDYNNDNYGEKSFIGGSIFLDNKRSGVATLAHEFFHAFDAYDNYKKYLNKSSSKNGIKQIESKAEAFEQIIKTNSMKVVKNTDSYQYNQYDQTTAVNQIMKYIFPAINGGILK